MLALGRELGRHTGGVVASYELVERGVDLRVVRRLVGTGVAQLWPGMYAFGAVGDLAKAHAAIKHARARRPGAKPQPAPVVTGLVAARALALPWVPDAEGVQVLVGADVRRTSYPLVVVRRCHDLADVSTWSLGGAAVADATRAVYDGARECASLRDVRGLVLGGVREGVNPAHVSALLDGGATAATAWTRRAVRDAERGCASPPEAEAVDAMLGCGRPFYVNPDLFLDGRFLCRPDLYLVGTGSGGELDSIEAHNTSHEQLAATLDRHTRVARAVELLHRTPRQLRANPHAFVRDLLAQADGRLARGLGDPPGLEIRPRGPLLR